MTEDLTVPAHETGAVRVFAVNLPEEEIAPFRRGDGDRIRAALGLDFIDRDFVETLKAADLKPIGLAGYLIEGLGIPADALAADRARLDALEGHVLLVHSTAFGGRDATISPTPEVTYIGTYREPKTVPSFDPLTSESAAGVLEGPATKAATAGWPRGLWAVLLGLAALVLIVLLLTTG
jgi:hypothetical protein